MIKQKTGTFEMRKTFQLIGISLIIAALLVSLIPVDSANAATDYQLSGDTLVNYTGTAQAVSVPSTVKTVGEGAFAGNSTVESVTIGSGTKKIAYAAFSNMSALKSASTGSSVKSIGNAVFSGDYNLTDVTIGSNVEEMGTGVFVGCDSLSSVSIEKGNDELLYADGAIYNKKMTVLYEVLPGYTGGTYTVPNSVTTIKEYAFYGCNSLETVTLGSGISAIPAFCFANCINLQTVNIPYSCTRIEMNAFLGDVNLSSLVIPASVYVIDDTAFDGCFRLTITAQKGTAGEAAANLLDMTTEADASEYQDTADVIKTVDNVPVVSGNDITPNDISGNEGQDPSSQNGKVAPEGAGTGEGPGANTETEGEEGVDTNRPEDRNEQVSAETESSSSQNNDPTRNELGNGRVSGSHVVVFVDNTQFRVRDGNDTDYLPYNSDSEEASAASSAVEASAAQDGSTMSNIYELMKEANEKGDVLPKYTVVDGKIVANQAFYYSQDEEEPTIPDGIQEIGEFAYARSNITTANIPEGVTTIDYAAFYHCNELTDVTFPSTVNSIGAYAFDRTAYMADWMKTGEEFLIVGDGFLLAYGGGYSVIHIPEGVKYIGPYAFAGHKGITTVYLPSSLETIEEGAFSNCTNLTAVEGGDNLTAIKDRAFYNCPIAAYTVSGTVQTIGLGAFANDADHESERSLVFAGEQIPALSYETTATRLTNADYRIAPLEGVDMAILAYPEQDLTGTVLQDGPFGYSGSFPDGGLVKDVSTNDSASGDVPVADDPVAEVSSGTEGAQSASGTVSHVMAGSIAIENNSLLLAEQFSYAKVEGATDGFILKIEDTAEEDSSLQTAYYRTYGEGLPANCIKADISLYESSGTVPVTRLGTQDISISMNVPDTLYSGKLHVVALDANGQLEELPYTRSNDTGTKSSRITFRTNHFSQFGFYSVGGTNYGTAVVSGGKAIFSSPLDDSPDTGDVIHPKWFLVLGLIFAGIALILAGSLGTRKRGML